MEARPRALALAHGFFMPLRCSWLFVYTAGNTFYLIRKKPAATHSRPSICNKQRLFLV